MLIRMIIFGAAGLALGSLVGLWGKKRHRKGPLTSGPLSGAIVGLIGGVLLAAALPGGLTPAPGPAYRAIPLVTQQADFERQVLQSPRPVLVDFYAEWCVYCKRIAPTIGLLSEQFAGKVDFIRVDGDKAPLLAAKYAPGGYPTVVIFMDGQPIRTLVGAQSESTYRQAIAWAMGQKGQPARSNLAHYDVVPGANVAP